LYAAKEIQHWRITAMAMMDKNPDREERITMEIIVDCYNVCEQAMGWYYYLEDTMKFPFLALCVEKRGSSPIKTGQEVQVIGMADSDDCEHEMFVKIIWDGDDTLDIPLSQLQAPEANKKTKEALEDWHYWVDQGYSFSDY
jgi:Calcium binding